MTVPEMEKGVSLLDVKWECGTTRGLQVWVDLADRCNVSVIW